MKKTVLIGIACITGMAATVMAFHFLALPYLPSLLMGYGWITVCALAYNRFKDEDGDGDDH